MLKPLYAESRRKTNLWLLFFSGLLSLILLIVLNRVDVPLKTGAAPQGIVSFELAGSPDASLRMMQSWDAEAKMYAAFSLGIDYLFMISYALFLSLLCLRLAVKFKGKRFLFNAGVLLGYGLWLAAALDAVENFALFRLLFGSGNLGYVSLASGCASVKFALVLLSFVYLTAGGFFLLLYRGKQNNQYLN